MKRLVDGMTMFQVISAMAGTHTKTMVSMKRIIVADGGKYILALLDKYQIYEEDIYNLFEVKCHGLVRKLYTLLMATHMGLITEDRLHDLCKDMHHQKHFTEEDWENFETIMRKSHEQTQKAQKRT